MNWKPTEVTNPIRTINLYQGHHYRVLVIHQEKLYTHDYTHESYVKVDASDWVWLMAIERSDFIRIIYDELLREFYLLKIFQKYYTCATAHVH